MESQPQTAPCVRRLDGCGNRFLLVDGLRGPRPDEPAAHAREACANDPFRPDGVLHLDRDPAGRLRMTVFNRDGSRPETCGNGLRCVAWHAVEAGHVNPGEFELVTDAGLARAQVQGTSEGALEARVSLGPVILLGPLTLGEGPQARRAVRVDCGNPHLVLFGSDLSDGEIDEQGPRLSTDPRFSAGTNVEFVSFESSPIRARVFERGVGETAACGSGACAIAAVAVDQGLAQWPVQVALPGGLLTVSPRASERDLWLAGAVSEGSDRATCAPGDHPADPS